MNIGHYRTEFPRNYGVPMRGWDPQNPSTLTVSLQLADKDTTIWEGQVITPNADGTAWELGVSTTTYSSSKPNIVAFAQNSTLSTDVMAANNLVGLSCSGKFRIACPFFCRTVLTTGTGGLTDSNTEADASVAAYTPGTPVTYCKNNEIDFFSHTAADGSVVTTKRSAAGFIRPAKANEPVIGVVVGSMPDIPASAIGTVNFNVPENKHVKSGALVASSGNYYMPGTGVVALSHTWEDAIDSSAKLDNSYYVVLDTTFAPTV